MVATKDGSRCGCALLAAMMALYWAVATRRLAAPAVPALTAIMVRPPSPRAAPAAPAGCSGWLLNTAASCTAASYTAAS